MSSRIIVKNVPKHLTNERFRDHFAAQGDVTDAKIMFTRSGVNRKFGYIGYRVQQDADQAVKYFNGTYIDTSKIVVEKAKPIGDDSLPRAWSRYTDGSSASERARIQEAGSFKVKPKDGETEKLSSKKTDDANPLLQEFLDAMMPRSKAKIWANDDTVASPAAVEVNIKESNKKLVASKKAGGEGLFLEKTHVKFAANDEDDLYEDLPDRMKENTVAKSETPDAAADAPSAGADDAEPMEVSYSPVTEKGTEMVAEQSAEGCIFDTGRLFLRNLSFACSEEDLKRHFGAFGPISEVHIPVDAETKKPKGFAYVLFLIPEHAVRAFHELDRKTFQGRLLHVLPGKERPSAKPEEGDNDSFKKKKMEKLRAASRKETNWNSLFMSSDAVAEAMARKLEVSKSDILDRDSDNMAVRLALAETHVIEETVKSLEEEGVDVEAFKTASKKERSSTIILVKNIPHSTEENELREIFSKFGDIVRFVLPATRTLALVEFSSPNEAKSAFSGTAYKNFKGRPMMLEMAPTGILAKTRPTPPKEVEAVAEASVDSNSAPENPVDQVFDVADTEEIEECSTLFVKNLSFETTNDQLSSLFRSFDGFRSASISTKADPRNAGKKLSMGFGFVEYRNKESAKKALEALNNYHLAGHALQVKFSDRSAKKAETDKKSNAANSTKIIVRNVPFEATRKDIVDLFGTFGQLKRVRLPKKYDQRSHRGFAFVEFLTKQEAANAYSHLEKTHLYGRHLVLEWAEDDESIDALRQKTRKHFNSAEGPVGQQKKIKIDIDEAIEGLAQATQHDD